MRDQKQSLQEQLSKLDSSISTNKKDIVFNTDEIPQLEEEIREQKLKLAGFYDVPTHEANALKEEIKKLETKLQAARTSILIATGNVIADEGDIQSSSSNNNSSMTISLGSLSVKSLIKIFTA